MTASFRLALAAIGLASTTAVWMSPACAQSTSSAPAPCSAKANERASLQLPADHSIEG